MVYLESNNWKNKDGVSQHLRKSTEPVNENTEPRFINKKLEMLKKNGSHKILRRISQKFQSHIKRSKSVFGKRSCLNNLDEVSNSLAPNLSFQSSFEYYGTPHLKRNYGNVAMPNDRVSNSSDTSRQSSTTSNHLRIGIDLFNKCPEAGVDYFYANNVIDSNDDLIQLFIRKKGFNRHQLYEFLPQKKNKPLHQCFCDHLPLKNKTIPEALQEYFKVSYISGEYQTMVHIVEQLSKAYCKQQPGNNMMGMGPDKIALVMQFLLRVSAENDLMNLKTFTDLLLQSFDEIELGGDELNATVPRQLAKCLYYEIRDTPLKHRNDEQLETLLEMKKMLVLLPPDFNLVERSRYPICRVSLQMVDFISEERPAMRERLFFLLNDIMIITKPQWSNDKKFRIKQFIKLSHIKISMLHNQKYSSDPSVTNNSTTTSNSNNFKNSKTIQVIDHESNTVLMSLYSKFENDLDDFYNSLNNAININQQVNDYHQIFLSRRKNIIT